MFANNPRVETIQISIKAQFIYIHFSQFKKAGIQIQQTREMKEARRQGGRKWGQKMKTVMEGRINIRTDVSIKKEKQCPRPTKKT